jgi:hypothetical protein
MRKLFLLLLAVVVIGFASDDYLLTTGTLRDSTWLLKSDNPWTIILFDTVTLHVEDGDSTIDLGATYYNFQFSSLNGAGDSGYVKIAFNSEKALWHDDSIARNLTYANVGYESGSDLFIAPIGARYVYIRPMVGGTADSTTVLQIRAVR